jgi:hypothetical protein
MYSNFLGNFGIPKNGIQHKNQLIITSPTIVDHCDKLMVKLWCNHMNICNMPCNYILFNNFVGLGITLVLCKPKSFTRLETYICNVF